MEELSKEIFGKTYLFSYPPGDANILKESVGLYPNSDCANPDVCIKISPIVDDGEMIAHNPSIFVKSSDAFITEFPQCVVSWKVDRDPFRLMITLFVPRIKHKIKKFYVKFRSMEFATDSEMFEQILHEFVLIPSVYFFDDLSIMHAATLSVNGKAILLTGTGGTGKTSALLALRNKENVSFISDDIAVISKDGFVYPNLAWPKVYGYNLSSYIKRNELLKDRGIIDKLQFDIRVQKNPKTVRRKLRPDYLYKSVERHKVCIEKIIYLFKDNSNIIELRDLDLSDAVEMGVHVMKTEYAIFHRCLEWDLYNSIAKRAKPLIRINEVYKNWKISQLESLKNAEIKILHIPSTISHDQYLQYMNKFISG